MDRVCNLIVVTCVVAILSITGGVAAETPAIVHVNKTDLTDRQSQSVITVELRLPKDEATGQVNDTFDEAKHRRLQEMIINRYRKRRATAVPTTETPTTETIVVTTATQATTTAAEPTTAAEVTTVVTRTTTQATTTTTTSRGGLKPGGVRRRGDAAAAGAADVTSSLPVEPTEEDLKYVNLNNKVKDGWARVPLFLDVDVDPDELFEILEEIKSDDEFLELGFAKDDVNIRKGLPPDDIDEPSTVEPIPATIQAFTNWKLWLVLLILIICFIVIVFVIFCLVRYRKKTSPDALVDEPKEPPIKPAAGSPTKSTPNGVSHHDPEDDGWIIPYDQAVTLLRMETEKKALPEKTYL